MIIQTEPLYRCDICGKEDTWNKRNWISIYSMLGKGMAGYEHTFHVCSYDCEKEFDKLSKKDREELLKKITI